MLLSKYLTEADTISFVISTMLTDLPNILLRTEHRRVEIVTRLRLVLTEIQNPSP